MNPFVSHGTGSYFFQPHSVALARAFQTGMVREMGLRDLGIHYDNLALVRTTWMPSVLCEGAFIIIPEQEAALRTTEFQAAYARGVVEGLESYFRTLASPPAAAAMPTALPAASSVAPSATTPPAAGP
jgi:N-acetylmuramoyl-L-alanine amidase